MKKPTCSDLVRAGDVMLRAYSAKEQAWKAYHTQPSRSGVLDAHEAEMAFRAAQVEYRRIHDILLREQDLCDSEVDS